MAFFNLWSSERLSFSLSIIAVVSAAITAYHQFSHSTEVGFYEKNFGASYVPSFLQDGSFKDSLSGSVTFMNSGSTPVSIIHSQIILHADTAIISREIDENPYLHLSPTINGCNSKLKRLNANFYLDEKSVSTYHFVTTIDSSDLKEIVNDAIPLSFDSTMIAIDYYLWLLMADPFGDFSMAVVKLGHYVYERETTKMIFGSAGSLDLATRQMPPFRNLDFWKDLSRKKSEKIYPPPLATSQGDS